MGAKTGLPGEFEKSKGGLKMGLWDDSSIADLVGKTLTEIKGEQGDETIRFTCSDGSQYEMYHSQDCCESVSVEDIIGKLDDLIGSPLVMAEENSSDEKPDDVVQYSIDDGDTWTFYKFATVKGYVTIRWYGTSNGYYSTSVNFRKVA